MERCAELLWQPDGRPVRDWLHARGFDDATLAAHRVGADPGPHRLPRPAGLPRGGLAAIYPVVDDGTPVYFQARYLDPDASGHPKYDNPTSRIATNPRLATYRPDPPSSDVVFVCEGIPDALSVTQHGHEAVAVLGAGLATTALATKLDERYPDRPLRVAFDSDARGRAAGEALAVELEDLDHPDVSTLEIPNGVSDLNDWMLANREGFVAALANAHPEIAPELGVALDL